MAWRIGVDSGGTFTDVCLFDDATGAVAVWKVPSTPDDPSHGHCRRRGTGCRPRRRLPRRDRLFRPRHDRRHQCADPAPRRPHRADHHRRVPRPAGDRAAEASRPVRHPGRQAARPRQPRPAAGGAGTRPSRRVGRNPARRRGRPRRGAHGCGTAGVEAVAVCFLYGFVAEAHEAIGRPHPGRGISRRLRLASPTTSRPSSGSSSACPPPW